jgi:hypothetical protein
VYTHIAACQKRVISITQFFRQAALKAQQPS